ncbi:MAG: multicopper oxidase family protein [Cyanobacteria bacterium P01_F01_bin.13]
MQCWRAVAIAFLLSAQILLVAAQPAQARPAERVVENPPNLRQEPTPLSTSTSTAILDEQAEKIFDLNIAYTDGQLYNPATQRYDKVYLRSYVGTDTSPERPYVAPTIELNPGDTARISLHNKLPADSTCTDWQGDVNTPHCLNGTNLHSHGLWISPTGNSDNMLLSINPGVSFQYEYNIPLDHPAGTFWYHTHRHGSTAVQVSSGMAGALIVRGDRTPSQNNGKIKTGDIDTLLNGVNGKAMPERILLLQQIQYACLDKNGAIKVQKDGDNIVAWVCGPRDKGIIEFTDAAEKQFFAPTAWSESGHHTSINGQILPTFKAKAGEIERWRMIHAGVRDTISLEFRKRKVNAPTISTVSAVAADDYIEKHCSGVPIPYHVIADDGLTRAAAWETELTTLQPGYRSDALVVFPEAGDYCVIDTSAPAPGSVSRNVESRKLLGIVKAEPGTTVSGDIHSYVTEQLVAAAERTMPVSIQSKVIDDLQDGLKLSAFVPHPDISENEVTGAQEMVFFIDTTGNKAKFEVSNATGANFDPKPYDPNRVDRRLPLGGVDEWTLQSYFVGHPFHIHVNPFQIVKILDPNGNDVSGLDAVDEANGTVDPQYRNLKGVWKDTLWIKGPPPGTMPPQGVYTVIVRTRYERYIGEFVQHCHILDHEDQGMMQNISVVLPSGVDGSTVSYH